MFQLLSYQFEVETCEEVIHLPYKQNSETIPIRFLFLICLGNESQNISAPNETDKSEKFKNKQTNKLACGTRA